MIFRFLFFLLALLLIDLYFFQSIKTIFNPLQEIKRYWAYRIYWGITIAGLLFTLFSLVTYQNPVVPRIYYLYVYCFILILFVSKLIGSLPLMLEDVSRLVRWIAAFFQKGNLPENTAGMSRGKFISYSALGLAAVPFSTMLFGMVKTAFDFKLRRVKIPIANLPEAFEGMKIIQISDIHSGSFISAAHFKNAVELINKENPDAIFFTGDLVNDRASEAEPFIGVWKELKSKFGVFSILGNHDYGDYVIWDKEEDKKANFDRLVEIHKEMGWDLLRNEHRVLEKDGQKIALLGVENWGSSLRFPKKGDMLAAQNNLEEVPVKILLSHDPSHWDAIITQHYNDVDLTLSGHTHGFQFGIDIPGMKWSPSQYVYPHWAGHYTQNNQHLYVNRGLGFLGYLGRVGIRPEITILELSRNQA